MLKIREEFKRIEAARLRYIGAARRAGTGDRAITGDRVNCDILSVGKSCLYNGR